MTTSRTRSVAAALAVFTTSFSIFVLGSSGAAPASVLPQDVELDRSAPGSDARAPSSAQSWSVSGASARISAPPDGRTPVPILMYHVIADPPAGAPYPELFVRPTDFASQMRWLQRHGYQAVTLRDVWNHWHRGVPLPRRPIVVSFDDGYRSVAQIALPRMSEQRWAGVLNLTVKNLRGRGGLSPRHVRRLISAGWEIDAHSLTHPDLPSLDNRQLAREVAGSRIELRRLFGVPVSFFCYPAGRYDARVIAAVRRAGYLGATTTLDGLAMPSQPYELRRVRVSRSDGLAGFGAKIERLRMSPPAVRTSTTEVAPPARPAATGVASNTHTYRWPVKPFDRQHPVRGFFGDPRIANHGASRQFHFGVDISAPNGTPVFATISGSVRMHALHDTTVLIDGRDGVEFSYWHVVPTVRDGQRATAYRTMIGRIEAPYGHVHFSEKRNGRYLNPLRPGAMGPFSDDTRPRVTLFRTEGGARLALVAEAYDETPLAVPRPWHDLPVTPALVRWRIVDSAGRSVLGWRTAADFRTTIPPASAFDEVWAPGTMQNHVRAPGRYRIYLSRGLTGIRAGTYVVEVAARDVSGNGIVARFALTIESALSGS